MAIKTTIDEHCSKCGTLQVKRMGQRVPVSDRDKGAVWLSACNCAGVPGPPNPPQERFLSNIVVTWSAAPLLGNPIRRALELYQAAWDGHYLAHSKSAASHCGSVFDRKMIEARQAAIEALEEAGPVGDGAACCGCGLLYTSRAWADVEIPDLYWEKINPSDDKGCGLLCFNCIVSRLDALGLTNVPFSVNSGPLSFNPRG